jgi:hypothetical protein
MPELRPGIYCPVCGEPAQDVPPRSWINPIVRRPRHSHLDGEPLCPTDGIEGYRPSRPVEAEDAPCVRDDEPDVCPTGCPHDLDYRI